MSKNRTFLLILVSLALGLLVFLDNRGEDDAVVRPSAPVPQEAAVAADDAAVHEDDAEAPVAPGMRLTNPLADFDKLQLKDWTARPLFAQSRKRPPQAAAASADAPQLAAKRPPPTYDLLGILRDGGRAIALLRKKGDGTSFRVEVGDVIGGWRVARMEPASVVLERADGTSETVALSRE